MNLRTALYAASLLVEFLLLFVLSKNRILTRNPFCAAWLISGLLMNLALMILKWHGDKEKFNLTGEIYESSWYALIIMAIAFAVMHHDPVNQTLLVGLVWLLLLTAGSRYLADAGAFKVTRQMALAANASFILPVLWMSAKLSNVWPQMLPLIKRVLASGVGQVNEYARAIAKF